MKVHIIEDEKNLQDVEKLYLEDEGFEITISTDGEQAVEETVAAEPDAIVLDMMLPSKSGFDVLREVRDKGCKVPVVVLTNIEEHELDKKKLESLGVRVILLKTETRLQDLAEALLALRTEQSDD